MLLYIFRAEFQLPVTTVVYRTGSPIPVLKLFSLRRPFHRTCSRECLQVKRLHSLGRFLYKRYAQENEYIVR